MKKIKMYQLAISTYNLINEYIEVGEDYSLLMNNYNDLIDSYSLDLPYMRWVNLDNYELV